jgi:hypothetical protein
MTRKVRSPDPMSSANLSSDAKQILKIHRKHDPFIVPRILPTHLILREFSKLHRDSPPGALRDRIASAFSELMETERVHPDSWNDQDVYVVFRDQDGIRLSPDARQVLGVLRLRRQAQEVGLMYGTILSGWREIQKRGRHRPIPHFAGGECVSRALNELVAKGIVKKISPKELGPERLYKYHYVEIPRLGATVWDSFGNDRQAVTARLSRSEIEMRMADSRRLTPGYVKRATEEGIKQLIERGLLHKERDGKYSRYTEFDLMLSFANNGILELESALQKLKNLAQFWELENPSPYAGREATSDSAKRMLQSGKGLFKNAVTLYSRRESLLTSLCQLSSAFERTREDTLRRIFNLDLGFDDFDKVPESEWLKAIATIKTSGGILGGPIRFEGSEWIQSYVGYVYGDAKTLGLIRTEKPQAEHSTITTPEGLASWGSSWPTSGGFLAKHSRGPWPTCHPSQNRGS